MNHNQPYNNIIKAARLSLLWVVLMVSFNLFAAKTDSKIKKGVILKFAGFDIKSFNNFSLFSKNAYIFKGSFSTTEKTPESSFMNTVVTFQRGNTTFIYPYQHKITLPKFKTPVPVQR